MRDEIMELRAEIMELFSDEVEKNNDIDISVSYGKHCFEHAGLVDFNEPVDIWNNRDILPAMVIKNCYIPIPAEDNCNYVYGNYVYKKKLH